MPPDAATQEVILISGLSGSGKSIALNVLEDAGYYCVDNLPPPLLPDLLAWLRASGQQRVGVAMDMRGGQGIAALPEILARLRAGPTLTLRFLFLQASDAVLIQRFSETRRRHPLAQGDVALAEAIAAERTALQTLATQAHAIDTSHLRPNTLRTFIKEFIALDSDSRLTLLFESFGFKNGLPLDADLVFDVRCLPNPYYDLDLRPLSGRDPEVIAFLEASPETQVMAEDIQHFIGRWLPAYIRDNRSYLTVAIGCTGGQHRSVYLVERLARVFSDQAAVLVRHRALSAAAAT